MLLNEMKVKDWMTTPVIKTGPKTPVSDAHELMQEYGVRRLPIVEGKTLVGIVTRNDLREASPSSATTLSIWEMNYLWSKLVVRDIMTRDVVSILEDQSVVDAADLMMNLKISGLPVLNNVGELVGVITESDIFRLMVKSREAELS